MWTNLNQDVLLVCWWKHFAGSHWEASVPVKLKLWNTWPRWTGCLRLLRPCTFELLHAFLDTKRIDCCEWLSCRYNSDFLALTMWNRNWTILSFDTTLIWHQRHSTNNNLRCILCVTCIEMLVVMSIYNASIWATRESIESHFCQCLLLTHSCVQRTRDIAVARLRGSTWDRLTADTYIRHWLQRERTTKKSSTQSLRLTISIYYFENLLF